MYATFDRCQAVQEKALRLQHPIFAITPKATGRDCWTFVAVQLAFTRANHGLTWLPSMFRGKYAEADPLFIRAIEIGEKSLGPDHPDLALWLSIRAWGLMSQVREVVINLQKALCVQRLHALSVGWFCIRWTGPHSLPRLLSRASTPRLSRSTSGPKPYKRRRWGRSTRIWPNRSTTELCCCRSRYPRQVWIRVFLRARGTRVERINNTPGL